MVKKGLVKDVVFIVCIIVLAITTLYGLLMTHVERIPGIEIISPSEIAVRAIKLYFKGNDVWIDVTVKNLSKNNQTMLIKVTAYDSTVVLRDFYTTSLQPEKEATVSAQYVAKTSFPDHVAIVVERKT